MYSCLSSTYQVRRTMCSGLPLASFNTVMMFCRAWRNCPAKPRSRHCCCASQPIWPAMNTSLPCATMPLEKPLARAHPGGWRICISASQLEALQLARFRTRQRRYELDRARILVRRDGVLHVLLQGLPHFFASLLAGLQDHIGLHDGAALGVGRTDYAALGHCRVREQRALDLRAGDVVAGGDDHVVGARLVEEVAVLVAQVGVAGDVPAAHLTLGDHVVLLSIVGEVAAARRALHR